MAEALTFAEVSAALRLDGGVLFWRVTRGKARAGQPAGRRDRQGYIALQLAGQDMLAHRVVWFLTYGEWPTSMLDHIDGNRANNVPSNLRLATNAQNQQNRRPTGAIHFKGVTPHRQTGKYQAQIGQTYLGLFDDPAMAARAYDAEASRRYGDFARLNFGATI